MDYFSPLKVLVLKDIIQVLPDHIANQIAAGEVIQRPASAVKELLENAVDAGANQIQLIVADAGKSLIQVIDNGKGMSPTDARMAFERHATSKIHQIDDLFHIKTMGFRGEALASIAAVAQVIIKTKTADAELGTYIEIENSVVQKQEACATVTGTNIMMKNLFFNVPARRNFLKSNAAELKHIIDEFIRVAMAFPDIFFSLTHNGQQLFYLEGCNLKQRVLQILGNQYNSKLVPVKEETDYLNVLGFVGKPDTARKTRGDQYFFVNNRFIKSAYLNHAVNAAFENLIAKDSYPTYVLYIQLDPSQIDINVHPTKQEIKFEDEKIVYAFIQAAVKHALAQFSVAPSLDFTLDPSIQHLDAVAKPFTVEKKEAASGSNLYQVFTQKNQAHFIDKTDDSNLKHWRNLYTPSPEQTAPQQSVFKTDEWKEETATLFQLHQTYIVSPTTQGFMLIHQQHAHERILYEQYEQAVTQQKMPTQKSLFPSTIHLTASDAALLQDLLADLAHLGFVIEPFGHHSFVIQGVPADVLDGNEKNSIELLLEQFKHFRSDLQFSAREKLIRCMARQQCIKAGQILNQKEMQEIVFRLMKCTEPQNTPNGYPTYHVFDEDALMKLFSKKN